jgi:phospholipid/cholesterol/gamma-HCH transport system substrate-binding protein
VINRGGEHLDQTARNINGRIDQVGKLLEQFQSIAARVDKGEGTAGLLIRDPKLYDSLVATANTLNLMMADLRRLVQQWEQEGLSFKLSK